MGLLVPDRKRGHEILDDAGVDAATRIASLTDVTRSNRIFGGRRAALAALRDAFAPGSSLTVLDVGTGLADIPRAITGLARERGARVTTIGLDEAADLLVDARGRITHAVAGNARALPFRNASVDVVVCSQLLHHFASDDLGAIIRELDRVARTLVVIADLRRSWLAAAGFWLASFPLRFHPVTRHDGVVSVFRGFTADELSKAVRDATGCVPRVERRLGFRLTATWSPALLMIQRPTVTVLGEMPDKRLMTAIDEQLVRAPIQRIFDLAADVRRWPVHLAHYRFVNILERDPAGGGLVDMSANRPFGPLDWRTWWVSEMEVRPLGGARLPAIRFRHVRGVTTGMDVEWSFTPAAGGTQVRIVHVWNGPRWPLIGAFAATSVIGPIFIHGIASRTLAGLARAAEA